MPLFDIFSSLKLTDFLTLTVLILTVLTLTVLILTVLILTVRISLQPSSTGSPLITAAFGIL